MMSGGSNNGGRQMWPQPQRPVGNISSALPTQLGQPNPLSAQLMAALQGGGTQQPPGGTPPASGNPFEGLGGLLGSGGQQSPNPFGDLLQQLLNGGGAGGTAGAKLPWETTAPPAQQQPFGFTPPNLIQRPYTTRSFG